MVDRRVGVCGLHNGRDLGGLPLLGGGVTPQGVFVRSESPDLVTHEGWKRLRVLGVQTVIDLRRPDERAHDTSARPDWLTVVDVDLHDPAFADRFGDEGLDGAALHYLDRLRESPAAVIDVFRAISKAQPGAVMIQCVGGRDRTGLISAILLAAVGVEAEAIIGDYLETVRNAPNIARAQGVPNWEPEVDRKLARLGTTTEESFRAFLADLEVEPLLQALDPPQAKAIRTWRGALEPLSA